MIAPRPIALSPAKTAVLVVPAPAACSSPVLLPTHPLVLPPATIAAAAEDMDAAGDGEVLVVMDLRSDEGLVAAGLAREVVNRVQRLRKKAGLQATDAGGGEGLFPCGACAGDREGCVGEKGGMTACNVCALWRGCRPPTRRCTVRAQATAVVVVVHAGQRRSTPPSLP